MQSSAGRVGKSLKPLDPELDLMLNPKRVCPDGTDCFSVPASWGIWQGNEAEADVGFFVTGC